MKPFTVLVVRAALGFDSLEEYTEFLRLPVVAFSTRTGPSEGHGAIDIDPDDAELVSDTIDKLRECVLMKMPPGADEDRPRHENMEALKRWTTGQVAELREQVHEIEKALAKDDDGAVLFEAMDGLRYRADRLVASYITVDSSE
jgi:hypothetical protein